MKTDTNVSIPFNEALLDQQPEIYRELIPEIAPVSPEAEPITPPEHKPDVQTQAHIGAKTTEEFGTKRTKQSGKVEV